jgi:hypothetical protein
MRRFIQEHLTPVDMEKEIDLTHLKRIRRSGKKTDNGVDIIDIILCAESTLSDIEIHKVVKDAQEVGIEITPRIKRVSRWPAYNSRQLAEFRTLWPVSLRKDSERYSHSQIY